MRVLWGADVVYDPNMPQVMGLHAAASVNLSSRPVITTPIGSRPSGRVGDAPTSLNTCLGSCLAGDPHGTLGGVMMSSSHAPVLSHAQHMLMLMLAMRWQYALPPIQSIWPYIHAHKYMHIHIAYRNRLGRGSNLPRAVASLVQESQWGYTP